MLAHEPCVGFCSGCGTQTRLGFSLSLSLSPSHPKNKTKQNKTQNMACIFLAVQPLNKLINFSVPVFHLYCFL